MGKCKEKKLYKDEAWLREKYLTEKKSACAIAELAGCSEATVRRWLKKVGISIRSKAEALSLAKCPTGLFRDREWLYQQYIVYEKSTRDIAEIAGCSYRTIIKWLDVHGIDARSPSEAKILKWQEPDYRKRVSDAVKQAWSDPALRMRVSRQQQEIWSDLALRRRVGKIIQERYENDPELRQYMRDVQNRLWSDPARGKRMSEIVKQAWADNPERRQLMSEYMSDLWRNPEFQEKMYASFEERLASGYRTDIERITEMALQAHGIAYKFNHRIGRYFVDFYLPNYKMAVECDGVYWHQDPEREACRDAYLEARGLRIVHLPGPAIRKDINALLAKELLPVIEQSEDECCKNVSPIQLAMDLFGEEAGEA